MRRTSAAIVTDLELWKQASDGDRSAFEALYLRYWELLLNEAYKVLKVKEEAEDIVQNIFIDLYGRLGTVHIQDVKGYLLKATRYAIYNRIRDYVTFRKHYGHLQTLNISLAEEPVLAGQEPETLEQKIAQAIAQLPEKCREAFLLSREHSLTYAQIGHRLGISDRTVEKHISKALKHLRKSLSDLRKPMLVLLKIFGY